MVDMRVTDVARLGALWRSGRSRADLIRGVVMLGSLAVATGDARVHDALGQTLRVVGARRAARREFEEAARLDPGEARYHVDLAGLLLDAGQPAAAAERLRQAARLKPRSVEIRLLLATALRRAGDMNGMAREYTEVRRLAPSGPLGELARQALNERSIR